MEQKAQNGYRFGFVEKSGFGTALEVIAELSCEVIYFDTDRALAREPVWV